MLARGRSKLFQLTVNVHCLILCSSTIPAAVEPAVVLDMELCGYLIGVLLLDEAQ